MGANFILHHVMSTVFVADDPHCPLRDAWKWKPAATELARETINYNTNLLRIIGFGCSRTLEICSSLTTSTACQVRFKYPSLCRLPLIVYFDDVVHFNNGGWTEVFVERKDSLG